MLAAKSSFSTNKTINRIFAIYLPPVPSQVTDPNTFYEHMLYLQSIAAKVNMKNRWMWEQRLTHLKSYGHIQKDMDTGDFQFWKGNLR